MELAAISRVLLCEIRLEEYEQKPVIVCLWDAGEAQETKNCEREETEHMLRQIPDMTDAQICHMTLPLLPDLEEQGVYAEVAMEKEDWKKYIKEFVKQILECKPEAVYVTADLFKLSGGASGTRTQFAQRG